MAASPGIDTNTGEPYVDMDGDVHANGTSIFMEGALLRLGAPTISTIASGVLTVTGGFTAAAAESSTTDTVDSITLSGFTARNGDVILIVADTGDTITFDDANIDLGAATRAVGPGGHLSLRYDGTSWCELTFLAGADNA